MKKEKRQRIAKQSMKMQSSISVTEACTVSEIKCAANDSVMADQILVTLNINKE